MKLLENCNTTDSLKIVVNGRKVNLIFQKEPNTEAADFIKKTLMNAYTLKTA